MHEMIILPPHKLEMRHKKDQDKQFYQLLDIFKTIVSNQGHLPNNVNLSVNPNAVNHHATPAKQKANK